MTRNFKRQGEYKLGLDFIYMTRNIQAVLLIKKNLDLKKAAGRTNIA